MAKKLPGSKAIKEDELHLFRSFMEAVHNLRVFGYLSYVRIFSDESGSIYPRGYDGKSIDFEGIEAFIELVQKRVHDECIEAEE
jgi:hypothetical protein